MNEWNEGISKWRANRFKNTFKKKYGRSLSASRKPFDFSRERKLNSRNLRSKKQRLHRVSPKMQREWAAGVSQWVMQREVTRSNHYFLKKFGIIKGNSSEEWKEGIQMWLDQGLLNKSWKWRATKGRFKPSKNRRRIKRLKSVISGENRLRQKTDGPNKREQTFYVSANSKAIPVPAVSFTNESKESKEAEEIEGLEKDKEENIKKGEESSNDSEFLEKQMKPRKNSKLFALGICSLVGTIVCLVYGLGYFYSEAVNTIVVTKKNGETGNMSHNSLVYQSDDEKRGSPINLVSEPTISPFGSFFSVKEAGGLEMLWVEPGTFTMGSPTTETGRGTNETEHNVTLTKGFYLGKYEVTQAQYEAVTGTNPSEFNATGNGNRPVETVNWTEAVAFCTQLTTQEQAAGRLPAGWAYVLPTESQWEYACRAGTTTAYSWGNTIASSNANYNWDGGANDGSDFKQTRDVGQYAANPWGFLDMHGNVWEWTADSYQAAYPTGNPVVDPTGPASGSNRVKRGGSWNHVGAKLRSARRDYSSPSGRYDAIGFRVGFQKQ
jgi:sulfatase modifying factor 1